MSFKNIILLAGLGLAYLLFAERLAAAEAATDWMRWPEQGVATRVPATQWRTLYDRWGLKGGGGKDWEWGFRAGNGTMGALALGDVFNDAIYLTHERMYVPVNESYALPDMAPYVAEFRKLISEQGYLVANKFYYEKAKELGYKGLMQTDPIHPAFVLKLRTPRTWDANFHSKDYLMTEDFQTGEVAVQWMDQRKNRMSRRLFVSRADNVMVFSVASETGKNLSYGFELESIPTFEPNAEFVDARMETDKEWMIQRARYQRAPGGYDTVLRVVAKGGEIKCDGKEISIRNAESILVLAAVEPIKDPAASKVEDLKKKLLALPADYAALLAPHAIAHGELYNRVKRRPRRRRKAEQAH